MTLFVPMSHFLLEIRLLGCVAFTSEQSIVIVARPALLALSRAQQRHHGVMRRQGHESEQARARITDWGVGRGHEPSHRVQGETPKLGQDVISSLVVMVPSSREWRESSFDTLRNLSPTWTNMASSGLLNRHIYTVKILYTR